MTSPWNSVFAVWSADGGDITVYDTERRPKLHQLWIYKLQTSVNVQVLFFIHQKLELQYFWNMHYKILVEVCWIFHFQSSEIVKLQKNAFKLKNVVLQAEQPILGNDQCFSSILCFQEDTFSSWLCSFYFLVFYKRPCLLNNAASYWSHHLKSIYFITEWQNKFS